MVCAASSLTPRCPVTMIPPPCRCPPIGRSMQSGWRGARRGSSGSSTVAGFARLRDRLAEPTGIANAARAEFGLQGRWPAVRLAGDCGRRADLPALPRARCDVRWRPSRNSCLRTRARRSCRTDHEAVGGDPPQARPCGTRRGRVAAGVADHPAARGGRSLRAAGAGVAAEPKTEAPEMRRPFAGLKDLLKH